ncbi:type I DNA topoisomerase [bacterium]|nr:type I DNA topoisomerase [bacterium]
MSTLVIVESPAKARTISGFLGAGYVVESSIGHIRDLPRNAADVPASHKGESWARLGVDTEHDFKPLYIVPKEKKQQITKLKKLLKSADELLLATDEDREGESIAWHLMEVLKPTIPVRRMVFHEITPQAIQRAMDESRDIDRHLVEAQEARRILDRLVGYEVSPVLWKMIRQGLSAGRVQSPAVRILVERERERMRFASASYWNLEGEFSTSGAPDRFSATLVELGGSRVASGKDFGQDGTMSDKSPARLLDEAAAVALAEGLRSIEFAVRSVERKPWSSSPGAPFRTSTLQQEAGRKLRFTASRTMRAAQRLYEGGFITYMRTDSIALSETAITAARSLVADRYGSDYLPAKPRLYKSTVKNAQEAHEAIRPAGEVFRSPEDVAGQLQDSDQIKLYDMVWKRTVASQMSNATGERVQVRLGATTASGEDAEFATSGKVISFPGYLRAYVEGSDDPEADLEDRERRLPALADGDALDAHSIEALGHDTKPRARYTEASLVKRLEELEIGRPSTYASIIQTIQDRGYAFKKGTALVPSFTAFAAISLLERHFPTLVDYDFTALMEDDLDRIAAGSQEVTPWLSRLYFGGPGDTDGNGHGPAPRTGLKTAVSDGLGDIDPREISSIPLGEDADGVAVVARVGRYGPYVSRGEDTAGIPDELPPDELSVDMAIELLSKPSGDRIVGADPESGLDVLVRAGRYGPYVQLGDADEVKDKPKTASLFKTMEPAELTLDDALRLLSLPRVVGADAEGVEITVQNGRYGPYIKRAKDTRSLETEDQIFTVTLDESLALLAQPKRRGGRSTAALREVGIDPENGCQYEIRDGRFGLYVTDGAVNASLRKDDSLENMTIERARLLLEARRQRMADQGKEAKPCPPAPKEPDPSA